ncbi:protein DUF2837 [Candidatus Termititenax spirochaetophilus]|uniref:Protein DUF2837 n=1 Tax=Candidatus Termititenax spirochaetophilus TaxID=2218522 RepID=A0A388T6V6_9BACT|nr:protein DUF2837 [Candidatus Termititenax spirochaetophilus]
MLIHMMESLALSMRLAGVRTGQIATSVSFVNVSFLVARLSNMFQAPLLGAMVDQSILRGTEADLLSAFSIIIFFAFIGNLLGAIMTPSMVYILERGIYVFDRKGSIPKLIFTALMPWNIWKILRSLRLPGWRSFTGLRFRNIPHTFIYLNFLMVAIYAVGVLASLLAGAFMPDQRATAMQLSGIVNGLATIMLAIMVDPTGAHITDQAVRGRRPLNDVRTMIFFLLVGRLFATLILAQVILWPAAQYIMTVTEWIGRLAH